MNYYYLDTKNQPAGPLPLDDIRRKAATGEIPTNPMVAGVGTSQWQPLAGPTSTPSPSGGQPMESLLADWVAAVQRPLAELLSPVYLRGSVSAARVTGNFAVLAGAVIGTAYSLYMAYTFVSLQLVLTGVFSLLVLAIAHYAARRLLVANEALITRSRLASRALPDCAGLLALCAAGSSLVIAVMALVRVGLEAWPVLPTAVVAAWAWTCFAAIAFHPETIQVEFAPGDAGEESLEVVQFLLKAGLSLVPLAFGVMGAAACIGMVLAFFAPQAALDVVHAFGSGKIVPLPMLSHEVGAGFRGEAGVGFLSLSLLITACLLPVLAHLFYIAASWPLSLWRSLISVSGKLDALKR